MTFQPNLALPCVLTLLLAGCAGAPPPPVCGTPAVLEQVADALRTAGRPLALDETSVGEVSAGTGRLVQCAVRGQVVGYDTVRDGARPIHAVFVVRYALELRANGIFVTLE